jgi:hypothetical protein
MPGFAGTERAVTAQGYGGAVTWVNQRCRSGRFEAPAALVLAAKASQNKASCVNDTGFFSFNTLQFQLQLAFFSCAPADPVQHVKGNIFGICACGGGGVLCHMKKNPAPDPFLVCSKCLEFFYHGERSREHG